MKISRIEHLGIAVQSIDAVLPYFRDVLGLEVYKTEVVEDQKVKTAFLKVGEVKLELLEPTCPESTVQRCTPRSIQGGGRSERGSRHVRRERPAPHRQVPPPGSRRSPHRVPASEEHLWHIDRAMRRIARTFTLAGAMLLASVFTGAHTATEPAHKPAPHHGAGPDRE